MLEGSSHDRAGRATLVQAVLSAMSVHLLIAINVPKWFIKAVDKIRRGFLWQGKKKANAGCYMVA
jgi:hypothetical protein